MRFPRLVSAPAIRLGLLALTTSAVVGAERMTWVDPDAPEVATIRTLGEAATAALAKRLVGELTAALAQGGPEAAVDVCHIKALPLTAARVPEHPRISAAKRTSLKLRNPANAPDAAERAALAEVAARLARGEKPPAVLVQRIEIPASPRPEWRVYRPVMIQPACLACHGPTETQSTALRAKMHARYPHDAATGYRDGEWRGLMRVTVEAPAERGGN